MPAKTALFQQEDKPRVCTTWIWKSVLYLQIILTMASVAIGLYYMDDCPYCKDLPIYMVYFGLFVLVNILATPIVKCFNDDQQKWYTVKISGQLIIVSMLLCFGMNPLMKISMEMAEIPTSLLTQHCHPVIPYFHLGYFGQYYVAILAMIVVCVILFPVYIVLYECCYKKIILNFMQDPEAPGH